MIFSYLFLKERPLIICISRDFGVESWPTPRVTKIDPRNSLGVTNNITATHIGSQRMSHQELLVKEIHKFWKISAVFGTRYFFVVKKYKIWQAFTKIILSRFIISLHWSIQSAQFVSTFLASLPISTLSDRLYEG